MKSKHVFFITVVPLKNFKRSYCHSYYCAQTVYYSNFPISLLVVCESSHPKKSSSKRQANVEFSIFTYRDCIHIWYILLWNLKMNSQGEGIVAYYTRRLRLSVLYRIDLNLIETSDIIANTYTALLYILSFVGISLLNHQLI